MAAMRLPKPGTKLGPCKGGCNHRDCAETRRMAEAVCRICRKPIGYEVRLYGDPHRYVEGYPGSGYVHAVCLEEEYEAERRAAQVGQ